MKNYLRLIHDDGEREITVAVHGLKPGWGDYDWDTLERQVHEVELRGSVYVLQWPANIVSVGALLRGDLRKIRAADEAGMSLARTLSRLRDAPSRPITLIGHSQGTLVIHSALEWLKERSRRVTRVLLMGGVVPSDAQHWENVAPAVRKEIVNVHSSADKWLIPLRGSIGRNPIDSRFHKIRDEEIDLGHFEYWSNLSYVLGSVWPERRRSRQYQAGVNRECPWCNAKLHIQPLDDSPCPECTASFYYDPQDGELYWLDGIRPLKDLRECPHCERGGILIQGTGSYQCVECRRYSKFTRKGNGVWIDD